MLVLACECKTWAFVVFYSSVVLAFIWSIGNENWCYKRLSITILHGVQCWAYSACSVNSVLGVSGVVDLFYKNLISLYI